MCVSAMSNNPVRSSKCDANFAPILEVKRAIELEETEGVGWNETITVISDGERNNLCVKLGY